MKPLPTAFALLTLDLPALPAVGTDLSKIDRTIAKEPAYSSKPLYALLVFGPEAAQRVWLVLDGGVLYVDRNGNGDLTEACERLPLDVEASDEVTVGTGAYKGDNVFKLGLVAGVCVRLEVWVRDETFVPQDEFTRAFLNERQANGWENSTLWRLYDDGSQAQNPLLFCERPSDAQICHLGGPLTFQLKSGERQSLKRGREDSILGVHIATPGLAPRNCRYPLSAPLTTSEVPADVHPVAQLEFPNATSGQPPIRREVALDRRCCGDTLYAPVRVPAEAGKGKVKVSIAFPAWKKVRVADGTFEIPIEDAPPSKK